ncbi:MAG: NTP transferase domain-containing protein [Chloroherpetonaceae bacterium]|nr:NTP transferase domain-containing protein [Chthonomonadaceae bacterium]MDW8208381.1 NTP transferase domain-containing protein [Chloroherpetonaceae bacterium]
MRPAIVLAAGAGRKFWPYNEVRNKCAFPIANEPLVARIVRQVRTAGFAPIVVVVGHQERSIRAALRTVGGSDLIFARQPASAPGTAAALAAGIEALGGLQEATGILAVYGDCVVRQSDLAATWQAVQQGASAAALVAPLHGDRPQDWIVCRLRTRSAGAVLQDIEGHGRDGTHRFAGVFALALPALPYLNAAPGVMTHVPVGGMPPVESELTDVLATMQDDGIEVAGVEAAHPCVDLDKPWHILQANRAVLQEKAAALTECQIAPTARIDDGAEISGPVLVEDGAIIGKRVILEGPAWVGAGARVVNGAIVRQGTFIGARSRVSDYCLVGEGCTIGNECIVGHGAEFDGVMLDRAYIYHYSEIAGVLGMAVDIGAATVCGTLRFDDADTIHRIAGRRELPGEGANATYFGDYSRTGVNVITQPGVKIGAYSCVGPGIVLYADVPSRKLLLLKQETIARDWGPERYGW